MLTFASRIGTYSPSKYAISSSSGRGCGAGVGAASYFGMRIGQQVLGRKDGHTALDGLAFQTRPLYYGNPWFLAPSIAYYRWRDRRVGAHRE